MCPCCEMVFKIPKDVSRPPLITPSASPPPRVPPSRINVASPSKRQYPSSVSRSSSLHRSVGASDSDVDIQMEREASRARLLDTWSQLAERYSRPLDEDDIVDIRTGEIVKDNGFWRATRRFGFGEVLAPEYQEETTTGESGDEDGADELDAFTEEHDYLEDVFLARGLQRPPQKSSNVDFEYDYDLKEFLEAEERRKEKYGSDLEEEDICGVVEKRPGSHYPPETHGMHEDDVEEYEESEGEEDETGIAQNLAGTSSTVCPGNSESDDELNYWAPTEASEVGIARDEVPESRSADEHSDSDSEVEVVELFVEKSLSDKQPTQVLQLHTPPRSYSSADQLTTGCIEVPLPHSLSTPTRPGNRSHTKRDRNYSVSPQWSHTYHSKLRSPISSRRAKTPPDVLELTDDEEENSEPKSSRAASPTSPLPTSLLPTIVSPIQRPRSSKRRLIPEVLITTLPPHMKLSQDKGDSSGPKSNLSPSRRPSNPSISSGTLLGNVTPKKSPKKLTPVEAPPRLLPCVVHKAQVINRKRRRSSTHDNSRLLSVCEKSSKEVIRSKTTAGETKRSIADLVSQYFPERADSDRSRDPQRFRSKSKSAISAENVDVSSSDEDMNYQRHHSTWRHASVSTATQNDYSTLSYHLGPYPAVADPRAQQIINSAMQQLVALLTGPVAAPACPYTPIRHKHPSAGSSFVQLTPDHPHPYPFSFDPSFSKATLPPSSPELPSSPIRPRERRNSPTSRSHSRRRHVSFFVDDKDENNSKNDSEFIMSASLDQKNKQHRGRRNQSVCPQKSSSKAKGKQKAIERSVSPFRLEHDGDEDIEDKGRTKVKPGRARKSVLGYHSPTDASASSSRLHSMPKHLSKERGK